MSLRLDYWFNWLETGLWTTVGVVVMLIQLRGCSWRATNGPLAVVFFHVCFIRCRGNQDGSLVDALVATRLERRLPVDDRRLFRSDHPPAASKPLGHDQAWNSL